MDLADVVAELYAAPLPDFVATRTRLVAAAKDAGDAALAREVQALRKPTVSAWLLNQVPRTRPEVLEVVQHVGHRMRTATAAGDSAGLRSLRPDRDAAIDEAVAAARGVAEEDGRGLSGAAEDEVRATVVAALASAESTEAWASGALLRALSYAGFGEVELDDAVAARGIARPAPAQASEVATTDQAADAPGDDETAGPDPPEPSRALLAAVDEAERELAAARLRADEAGSARDAARRRAQDLRALLAAARDEVREAEAGVRAAGREVAAAEKTLRAARAAVD